MVLSVRLHCVGDDRGSLATVGEYITELQECSVARLYADKRDRHVLKLSRVPPVVYACNSNIIRACCRYNSLLLAGFTHL